MKKLFFFLSFLFVFSFLINTDVNAQEDANENVKVVQAAYFDISPPLRDMQPIEGFIYPRDQRPKKIMPNHFRNGGTPPEEGYVDPASQKNYSNEKASANILTNFDGAENSDNTDGLSAPPDTQGDVGPNHYVQAVNNVTEIFNKSGTSIWGPNNTSTFWDGFNGAWTGTNDGDPIILYDETVDRWFVSQFAVNTGDGSQWILIAVSVSSDPTGSYARYAYEFSDMPDYPKFGIWHDGYYMSINRFSTSTSQYQGTSVCAFDRSAMILGNTSATMIQKDFGSTADPYAFLPADCDGTLPTSGPCPLIFDTDDDTYWTQDRLKIYEFDADWTTPANSTCSEVASLTPTSFNSDFSAAAPIDQPGTTVNLDALNDRMMFRANYRDFGSHESIVVSRTVNVGSEVAGIRWYELRNTGSGWTIYQESTYNPGDGDSRWMPSIAINSAGDIALGYSVSGASTYPSIRVTGRYASDPLNSMTITETEVLTGSASQDATSGGQPVTRWGDYSMMSVDSDDDFWYTQEYTSGDWYWKTRITEFDFPASCTPPSSQATNFSATAIGDNQMTINWTRGNTGNTAVVVLAKEGSAVDGLPSSGTNYADNSTFGSGDQIGSGNYVVYDGTGTSVTVDLPNPGTTYHYAIFEYNTADDCYLIPGLTGSATTTGTAPCTYCEPSYSNTTDDWITNVTFNTINNTTVQEGAGSYGDYTNISTDVTINSTYELSVSFESDTYTEHVKAWVDWNQDCDFDDAGEEFDLGDGVSTTLTTNITIPPTALTGTTTMRVAEKWDEDPTSCDIAIYGEAEDYTINIISATAPTITTSETSLDFGTVGLGYYSEKSYDVSGVNLSNDITITAPTGFSVSLTSGAGFTDEIILPHSSGTVAQTTIYVAFEPLAEQDYSGNVTNISSGATQKNVAVTGTGIDWFPAPQNFIGTINGTDADLSWDSPATNNSTSNWYEYANPTDATFYSSAAYTKRLAYFHADELSFTYPIKITQLRGSFFEDAGNWNGHDQFKFVIYGENRTTLLYESPIQTAVSDQVTTFTIPDGITITGDFFVGVETIETDGAPFSNLKQQADNNYHTYTFDGTDWYYLSDGTNAYDADFGVYIDGAKGNQYITLSNWEASELETKQFEEEFFKNNTDNNTAKSALNGYIVYRDGVDISGTLPVTQTTYTDANICGNTYTYSVTATYSGYDGESDYSNNDIVTTPLAIAPTSVDATDTEICSGDNIQLNYTGGSGDTFEWFAGTCGGTPIGTGNNFTVSPTSETTYYGRWKNDCGTSACESVTVSIINAPSISAQPDGDDLCIGDNLTLSVSATGTDLEYLWYKDNVSISGATNSTYVISNASNAHAGTYKCVVSNSCNSETSSNAIVNVYETTTIDDYSGNQSACVGAEVTFSVDASGNITAYEWYKDAVLIPGEDQSSLTLSNVSATDEADYTCKVIGTCGVETSTAMTLTITTSMVLGDISNKEVCLGETAEFTVSANGTGTTYQWRKNGTDLVDGGDISGVNTETLSITNVDASDEDTYSCYVESDCGNATSNDATLTLLEETTITTQPQSTITCLGENVEFSIVANNATSYQWKKNNVDINGANQATLSLTNITSADEGVYMCVVSSDCDNVNSDDATLTLIDGANITAQPQSVTECSGEIVEFSVSADNATAYQWKKDNVNIVGETNSTLTLNNISTNDQGAYLCVVTGQCGEVNSDEANLTVTPGAQITEQPQSVSECADGNVEFSVSAYNATAYQWKKDNVNIDGETSSTLTLNNISASDEGTYLCVITGECGEVNSDEATLGLNPETEIVTHPVAVTDANLNETVVFTVVAIGSNLEYQWMKDNSSITGATENIFTIDNVTEDDQGTYNVAVNGDCGIALSNDAILTVITNIETIVELGMSVYPNPNNGRFTIEFDKIINPMEIQITDAKGQIIYYGNLNDSFNQLDLGQQTAGVYFMKIYDQNSSRTIKFVIK